MKNFAALAFVTSILVELGLIGGFINSLVQSQYKAPVADEPQPVVSGYVGYSYNFTYNFLPEEAPKKITPIKPLSAIIAAIDCGCQSGRACKCHKNGAHCFCAQKIRQAKANYRTPTKKRVSR